MYIKTKSGTLYSYDRFSNRIRIIDRVDDCEMKELLPINFSWPVCIYSLPNLESFTLEITRKCNFRCAYCCYSGSYRNMRIHGNVSMDRMMISSIFDFIERYRNHMKPLQINFYGGEALLELDLLQYAVGLAEEKWKNKVNFQLSTNGSLLNEEYLSWLVNHSIGINVSLDGNEIAHDCNRKWIDGRGTYQCIYNNLRHIKEEYPDYFTKHLNLLVTLSSEVNLLAVAMDWGQDELLHDKSPFSVSGIAPNNLIGVPQIHPNANLDKLYGIVAFYSQNPGNKFMRTYLDELLGDIRERTIFDLKEVNPLQTCLPQNHSCFIDSIGQIGVCEKMCDTIRIGDIYRGIDWTQVNNLISTMASVRHSRCAGCEIVRLCDTCLTCVDLNDIEMDLDCANKKANVWRSLLLFCELTEARLINWI